MSAALEIHTPTETQSYRADAPMISMIERIAMDPNIPLDRLEKMLDMKERSHEGGKRVAALLNDENSSTGTILTSTPKLSRRRFGKQKEK